MLAQGKGQTLRRCTVQNSEFRLNRRNGCWKGTGS